MEARTIKGKTVVITGGATGIGYELADNYLKKGAKVVIILDINSKQGADAATKLTTKYGANRAVFYKCDVVADMETVLDKIFDIYKTIDVFVNNAGILNEREWKKSLDINVTSLVGWSLRVWDHMRTDRGGRGGTIINLASILGYRIFKELPVYQASKFAVMGFTRSLGHTDNFKRSGVRVVAICPGFTKTDLTKEPKTYDDEYFSEELMRTMATQVWQEMRAVGMAAVDVFEHAESGSAWLIEGGNPITEVL